MSSTLAPSTRTSDSDDDEALATRHRVPLLITAPDLATIECVARRVHRAAFRAGAPFISISAARPRVCDGIPLTWLQSLGAATGGSALVTNVADLSLALQETFVRAVPIVRQHNIRLMVGTTVPLFDLVIAGRFSHALYYRLNVIHINLYERRGELTPSRRSVDGDVADERRGHEHSND